MRKRYAIFCLEAEIYSRRNPRELNRGGQEVERYAVGDRASSRAGEYCAVGGGAD